MVEHYRRVGRLSEILAKPSEAWMLNNFPMEVKKASLLYCLRDVLSIHLERTDTGMLFWRSFLP